MSEKARHPVRMLLADLTQPESLEALEEFTGPGELRDRIRALAATGTRFIAVLVGTGVVVVPLPALKDLIALQKVILDLALNLGIVAPVPLSLDPVTHQLLIDEIDAQVLSTGEVAGHA